jgi:ubiquinone/menaquinone biosynthesis C-methylase UbiE
VSLASLAEPSLSTELKTCVDVIDLGAQDPRSAGILSPDYPESFVRNFIHEQFLEDADGYVDKYTSHPLFTHLLTVAQRFLKLPTDKPVTILDLGSGAGNTVFPLLDLYPQATVVATDLSVPLLRTLRQKLVAEYSDRDCRVMQLNAEELVFEDGQFDLVVGSAILHHLFDPEKAMRESYRVLKPGSMALFFEPFEAGQQILGLTFKHLAALNEYRQDPIPADALEIFKKMSFDFEVRKGSKQSLDVLRKLDDKWLFTRSYLERAANRCGFEDLALYPLHGVERLFTSQVETYLRLCGGQSLAYLPEWARRVLSDLDQHFSADARQDLILEGGIVLRK